MFRASGTMANIKRLQQILTVLAKNGLDDIVATLQREGGFTFPFGFKRSVETHLSKSERLKKSVEELGPTFIKFAQVLSTRPDLIGPELIREFGKLQDEVTPVPFEAIEPVFFEEFGKRFDELFSEKPVLLASASIGQVYKTRLFSGEAVVVKVRKPGIEAVIRSDLAILNQLASLLDKKLVHYGIESAKRVVEEFARTINKELNYALEALNLKRFYAAFSDDTRIVVPKLYDAYSSEKVLTMGYIEGIKVSNLEKLEAAGIDAKQVARQGFDLLCEQIFKHRFFHADPHPGNLFVLEGTKIAFIDFGMMGKITQKEQKTFTELIYYIVKNEEEKAALILLEMTKTPEDIDRDGFSKEMGDLFGTYFYGELKAIRIKTIFDDITSLMAKYKVYFKEDYYLLVKALITVEGVGKHLDPHFNASEAIKPTIARFYREQMALKTLLSRMGEMPREVLDFFSDFPEKSKKLLNLLTEGKFKVEFEHIGLEALEESIEKSANRLSIAIIIAAVLIGSALLLLAKTPPLIFEIPILGLAGFTVALVMSFILILSIFKKGRL